MTNTSHWPVTPVQHLPGQCQQRGCSSQAVGSAVVQDPDAADGESMIVLLCADGLRTVAEAGGDIRQAPMGTPE